MNRAFISLIVVTVFISSSVPVFSRGSVPVQQGDTVEIKEKIARAIDIIYEDPDSAYLLAKDALELSEELKYLNFSIDALRVLGYVATIKGNYTEALQNDLLGLEKAKVLGDSLLLAMMYNNLGDDELEVRNYEKSHEYFNTSLAIAEKIDNSKIIGIATFNLGLVLKELEQYDGALSNFKRSLDIGREHNDPESFIHVNTELGHIQFLQSNFSKADEYYNLARQNFDSVSMPHVEMQVLDRYAMNLLHLGELDESEQTFRQSLKIAEELDNKEQQAKALNGLALLAYSLNRFNEAENLAKKSILLSSSSRKKEIESESYRILSDIYKAENNYEMSLMYFKKHHHMSDSILIEEKKIQLDNLQLQFDIKMKDLEITSLNNRELIQIQQLERQDRLRNILVILMTFLSVLLITVYVSGRKRRKMNILLREHRDEVEKQKNELSELNKVKDKFFSILAHDLRSPIRSLSGVLKLLEANHLSPEETRFLIGSIARKTDQTQRLLDNLLEWALIQMDKITVNKSTFSLKETIDGNIDLLSETTDKMIKFNNKIEGLEVYADKNMIDLIIRNLLSNAIKYSQEQGEINIYAEKDKDSVIVHVSDNGIGIIEELQVEIFADSSLITKNGTANEKGTGLGLKISKEFIERNNGKIWLESVPGIGSTFSFSLPLAETIL